MPSRLHSTVAELGWLNAGLYLLDLALRRLTSQRWCLRKYQLVAQTLSGPSLAAGRGTDIDVRLLASAAELPPGYPRPAAVIADRYAQGARSLAAFRGGELTGFLWFLADAYQEDEVRVRFRLASPQAVWDFDVYVRPQDRLGWTFRRLWDEARAMLSARGVRWSCSRISAFNAGSLRTHARIGTAPLGCAVFLCCGGWQWMAATLAPYIHLSRHPASFPQLLLDTTTLHHPLPPEAACRSTK